MNSSENEPVRVLIADGDPLVCRALGRLLHDRADISVVAQATDANTALRLTDQLQPDVALFDAGSVALGAMELTITVHRLYPRVRIVVLGIYATFCDQALAAGACQFLLKDSGRDELVAAIRHAGQEKCLGAATPSAISPLTQ